MRGDKRSLTGLHLLTDKMETSSTEAFETMEPKSYASAALLFSAIVFAIWLATRLIPEYMTYVTVGTSRDISNGHATIFAEVSNLSYLVRSVDFGCRSVSRFKRPNIFLLSGLFGEGIRSTEIYTNVSERVVTLDQGAFRPVFRTRSKTSNHVTGVVEVEIAEGMLSEIVFTWRFRSNMFLFVSVTLRCGCYTMLILLTRFFCQRISSLTERKPSDLQLFLSNALKFILVVFAPLPELKMIGLHTFPRELVAIWDILGNVMFLWLLDCLSWSLTKRFQMDEANSTKRVARMLLFLVFVHLSSTSLTIKDPQIKIIADLVPYVSIGIMIMILFIAPLQVESQLPEFLLSLVHVLIGSINGGMAVYSLYQGTQRHSTLSLLQTLLQAFSLLLITLFHWPIDENGHDIGYTKENLQLS